MSAQQTELIPVPALTQCQFCHKPQSDSVCLQRCSRCKIFVYCSVTCQREAWKSDHKIVCARIDFPALAPQGSGQMVVAAMCAFAEMHLSTLANVGIGSLDLETYPDLGRRYAFFVRLKLRPESTVAEKMFEAVDAKPIAIAQYTNGDHDRFQEFIVRLESSIAQARLEKNLPSAEGFYVILFNLDYSLRHILPIFFDPAKHYWTDFGPEYPDLRGVEGLLTFLNEGIARRRGELPGS